MNNKKNIGQYLLASTLATGLTLVSPIGLSASEGSEGLTDASEVPFAVLVNPKASQNTRQQVISHSSWWGQVLTASLDYLIPSASAADVIVSSTSPGLEFEDTSVDVSDSDTDNREWLMRGRDQDFIIYDDSNDLDAPANFVPVFKIEALGNYTGHAKINTATTENSIVIEDTGNISFGDGKMYLDRASGKLGLGTTSPDGQLHISGAGGDDVFAGMGPDLASGPALNFGYAGASFGPGAGFFNVRPIPGGDSGINPSLRFATKNVQRMVITNGGNVGIGDIGGGFMPTEALHVVGNIRTNGDFIDSGVALNVPDYVFKDEYKLMSLADLKAYIAKESHLPGVKSAKEVAEEGLNLSQSQMALLEKVEELTLYTLQQQDELENKTQLLDEQSRQLTDQQKRISRLEMLMQQVQVSQ